MLCPTKTPPHSPGIPIDEVSTKTKRNLYRLDKTIFILCLSGEDIKILSQSGYKFNWNVCSNVPIVAKGDSEKKISIASFEWDKF